MAPLARTVKPLDRVCPTQWPASQISPHATQPRPDIGPPHGEKARFAPTLRWEQAGFELSVSRQRRDPLATDNQGEEVRFALDALPEEDGFEASVPGE